MSKTNVMRDNVMREKSSLNSQVWKMANKPLTYVVTSDSLWRITRPNKTREISPQVSLVCRNAIAVMLALRTKFWMQIWGGSLQLKTWFATCTGENPTKGMMSFKFSWASICGIIVITIIVIMFILFTIFTFVHKNNKSKAKNHLLLDQLSLQERYFTRSFQIWHLAARQT